MAELQPNDNFVAARAYAEREATGVRKLTNRTAATIPDLVDLPLGDFLDLAPLGRDNRALNIKIAQGLIRIWWGGVLTSPSGPEYLLRQSARWALDCIEFGAFDAAERDWWVRLWRREERAKQTLVLEARRNDRLARQRQRIVRLLRTRLLSVKVAGTA